MKNLKNQLIRLGDQKPELRRHLKPILDVMSKVSSLDQLRKWRKPDDGEDPITWLTRESDPFKSKDGIFVFPDLTFKDLEYVLQDLRAKYIQGESYQLGGREFRLEYSRAGDPAIVVPMLKS